MKNNAVYYLMKIDKKTSKVEYFDFDFMQFIPERKKPVPLSTIDAMTTLFTDGQELDDYLNKNDERDKNYNYDFKIVFKLRKKDANERIINPVWNDPTLSAISKISDGKVDFTYDKNLSILLTIIEMVKKAETGLARRIVGSKKDETCLNAENKKLIGALANSSKMAFTGDLMEIFSSYTEFRALYLNYKEHGKTSMTFIEQLRKIRDKL